MKYELNADMLKYREGKDPINPYYHAIVHIEPERFENKLLRYILAKVPIIYIKTFEEDKLDYIIQDINYSGRGEIYEWNETNGYVYFESKTPVHVGDCSLEKMLELFKIKEDLDGKLIILKDISSYLNEPKIVSKIKGLVRMINKGANANIIIVSSVSVIPEELEKFITILEMDYPTIEEIKIIIRKFFEERRCLTKEKETLIDEFALVSRGLTEYEISNVLEYAYADNAEITREDLKLIFEQKQQMIKKADIIEEITLKETIDDIGGLDNLKEWLKRKAKIYKNMDKARECGVDMPKGVLIAGVAGCGKSLSAKAAANLFEVPLLRLDMGRLMGKYVGESEANLRKAITLAETISPCVLWIDELEKAFAGIGGAGGAAEVTTRLFGNFLTWMQEKDSLTFVVATANDITKLPPELLRKGRFDDIFFVNLPEEPEREKIFKIHINKRCPQDLKNIDIEKISKETEGFSGADIEGVVKDTIECAFVENKLPIKTEDIINVIKDTNSLSEVMGEDVLKNIIEEYGKRKFRNASKQERRNGYHDYWRRR